MSSERDGNFRVAHLTTVDMSLRFLVAPQMLRVIETGGEAIGISSLGPWVDELEAMGIRHIALSSSTRGFNPLADLRSARQLWSVLRQEDLSVLHTHNPKPGIYGRILGKLAGVPLVVNTVHGLYATRDDRGLKRLVVYLLEAVASRFSDVELYQNPEDLDLARSLRLVSRKKSVLLGNGVDLERFNPAAIDHEARIRVREEVGAAESDIVVGVVGRLVVEKGYLELFEAASQLDASYVVVAIGPEDPDKADGLSSTQIDNARENGVRFVGMRDDVKDIYSALDIFCLASHREGFPRAAMEAAAMGLPIVATDIRGCRQVVEDGVNGRLIPVEAPDALRDAIKELGEDESRRRQMGLASQIAARERFDEHSVVEIVDESYRTGLSAKGMSHLLPRAASHKPGRVRLRPATTADALVLANMHADHISTGFLPRLGRRFMIVLYRTIADWQGAVTILAEDDDGPVGFVCGVDDTRAFYRYFVRCHWFRAGVAALPRLFLPSNLRRAWETFLYGQDGDGVAAELLSMTVAMRARRQGLSLRLGDALLAQMAARGVTTLRVVVGIHNRGAIGAYRKMGFAHARQIEMHAGEQSEVMVWRQ